MRQACKLAASGWNFKLGGSSAVSQFDVGAGLVPARFVRSTMTSSSATIWAGTSPAPYIRSFSSFCDAVEVYESGLLLDILKFEAGIRRGLVLRKSIHARLAIRSLGSLSAGKECFGVGPADFLLCRINRADSFKRIRLEHLRPVRLKQTVVCEDIRGDKLAADGCDHSDNIRRREFALEPFFIVVQPFIDSLILVDAVEREGISGCRINRDRFLDRAPYLALTLPGLSLLANVRQRQRNNLHDCRSLSSGVSGSRPGSVSAAS